MKTKESQGMKTEYVGHSKFLEDNYIFYQKLGVEFPSQMIIKALATSNFNRIVKQAIKTNNRTNQLDIMAKNELKKEEAILNKVFGANLQLGNSPEDMKLLIQNINKYLSFKEVYNRNLQMIKNTQGQKGLFSFFGTYFERAWNKVNQAEFINNIVTKILDKKIDEEIAIMEEMEPIMQEALTLMINAGVENGVQDEQLRYAYQELLNKIGTLDNSDNLASQFFEIYGLDEVVKKLKEELQQQNTKAQKKKAIEKAGFLKQVMRGDVFHSRGGLGLEAFETNILSVIADNLNGKGIQASASHSGWKGAKIDNVLYININPEPIEKLVNDTTTTNREENIALYNKVGKELGKLNDSFAVYFSDKNYTYNSNFKGRGGFGVEDINIGTFRRMMQTENINGNIDTLVGAILQTKKGAIAEGKEEVFEQALAKYVAFFLFDDYETIGNESGGNAIHIMNLDGVLFPLSFILWALSRAIRGVERNPRDIVKTNISAGQIRFQSFEEEDEWVRSNNLLGDPPETHSAYVKAWEYQKEVALDDVRIQAKILADFKKIVQDYGVELEY